MSVHCQGKLRSAMPSVQAMGAPGLSLDFKIDRVENRIGLSDHEGSCTRDRKGDQIEPWRQQESRCSSPIQDRILTVHRAPVR